VPSIRVRERFNDGDGQVSSESLRRGLLIGPHVRGRLGSVRASAQFSPENQPNTITVVTGRTRQPIVSTASALVARLPAAGRLRRIHVYPVQLTIFPSFTTSPPR
jgi:hypothetical protein